MESVKGRTYSYLLDTHVLLWWLFDDPKLSGQAHDIIQAPDNTILVSSASGWEIATKHRLGKLPHAGEAVRHLPFLLHKSRMTVLPIVMEHALAAGALPGPHRDPFDRMLIAQGQIEEVPIITSDRAFHQYSVELVW
jgi:PIN domain nuclease of toxin-antitoxin system